MGRWRCHFNECICEMDEAGTTHKTDETHKMGATGKPDVPLPEAADDGP